MKYRCKYEYTNEFSRRHVWTVIGRHLAVHLHISECEIPGKETINSAGIEYHFREPPEHMKDEAPSQDRCWLLGAPCWHDGSSLQASEFWVPIWESAPHNHEHMFALLQGELENRTRTIMEVLSEAMGTKEARS